ncbi:MAG TPA: gluconate 2-dehydrogenase subunit 3 family protein [Cyclobacteriaceae bacterium]|nr:gluconate 2-dehydrogenase subunit 3 family protein [Cyclobacteriaceae bacterium]
MNRRDSLKTLMTVSAGLITLPAWANNWTVKDVSAFASSFKIEEQNLLASVADTIIPAGNSIGALSVGVDKFLQKLLDDCYEKETQDNVKAQLAALNVTAMNLHTKPFSDCDQLQRQNMLLKFSTSENQQENEFFKLIKSETIRGFNTSKEVMINYLKYQPVPAHFYGCVDLKS